MEWRVRGGGKKKRKGKGHEMNRHRDIVIDG